MKLEFWVVNIARLAIYEKSVKQSSSLHYWFFHFPLRIFKGSPFQHAHVRSCCPKTSSSKGRGISWKDLMEKSLSDKKKKSQYVYKMCLLILKSSTSFISALPYILWNERLCLLLSNFQVSAEQMKEYLVERWSEGHSNSE